MYAEYIDTIIMVPSVQSTAMSMFENLIVCHHILIYYYFVE
jgi:hypothetical protein